MELVAIADPGDTGDAALEELAAELGTTLYELRLLLNAGYPAVVLASVERERVVAARRALARHQHRVVTCSDAQMTPSSRMIQLRDFVLQPDALVANHSTAPDDRLRYAEIGALVRATHRTESSAIEEIEQRKLRPGMAIMSGGLIMTKTVKREVTTTSVAHEQVLYVFPRDALEPMILRERSAHYRGLGPELRPTSFENFATTVERLCTLAPGAAYDERLKTARPIRGVATGITATDWYAHLLARDALGLR